MTEAKILVCENCNTTVMDTGIGTTDTGTRVITIIEATDEADGISLMSSNSIFGGVGGGGSDKRLKRGLEAAALAGNETKPTAAMVTTSTTATEDEEEASLTAEMLRVNPSDGPPKPVPIKRDTVDGVQSDMTQAIMEQRVDYDVDDEFVAANGHGYDAPRTRPVKNNYRGYSQRIVPVADGEQEDRLEDAEDDDDGDHNSHYEYVPMEFDADGNHR